MKIFLSLFTSSVLLLAPIANATADTSTSPAADALLERYRAAGAGPFSAEAGQQRWMKAQRFNEAPVSRSCGSCHSSNLKQAGKHAKTQKPIKPMAPATNPERLTDSKKIEKWFKRNCKWTFGRECSPQEKGDFLLYIQKPGV